MWRPRRTITPSRPTTTRAGSTGAGSATGSDRTEISSARPGSSSSSTGGKRGSSCAAATVTSRTTAPSSRSAATCPMQPRSAPRSLMVTKAPRSNAAPGTAGSDGSGRPARCASSVARASASSAARSAAVSSGAAMVRLSAADRVGTVQLLVQQHPRQLVREGEPRQAPHPFRLAEHRLRKRLSATDRERHVASVLFPARRPVRNLRGGPLPPPLRQRHEARAVGNRPENPRLVLYLALFHLRVVPEPLQVSVTGRPERRVLHAAHRDDAITHQAYIPRSRCIAATRSTA